MSKLWYVVREDTRTLIDIIPNHISAYYRNIHVREAHAVMQGCIISNISLIHDTRRVKSYKGLLNV